MMMKDNYYVRLGIFLICAFYGCEAKVQCLNKRNQPVDWFVLYKLPIVSKHSNANVKEGVAYIYATSDELSKGWMMDDEAITSENSLPGLSISQIFSKGDDKFSLAYNDESPTNNFLNGMSEDKVGHTKGVVIGDADGGVWLVHSVPKYPDISAGKYDYPETGNKFGQSFLCVTYDKEELDKIGVQLIQNDAGIYSSSFSDTFQTTYPQLWKAAKGEGVPSSDSNREVLTSSGKNTFISFAKSSQFGKDIFSQWMSDNLKTDLLVETWIEPHRLPTDCDETYPVMNVKKLSLVDDTVQFTTSKDHSKWAISAKSEKPWVCIGDINRAEAQFQRGGGMVCFMNSKLWNLYFQAVAAVEPCPKKSA